MKVFRELTVQLNGTPTEEFAAVLERHATGGWQRDAALDARLRQLSTHSRPAFTFVRQGLPTLSPVYLAVAERSAGLVEVANIISGPKGELTPEEYNGLLMEFHDMVLAAARECGATVRLTPEDVSLRDLLPYEVFERLEEFSSTAERIGGTILPRDMARWLDFIAEVHHRGCVLEPRLLARWLREEEHWPEDAAARLTEEYEFGRGLLSTYDSKAG